jgi:RHS repeat-associated protein
MSGDGLTDIVRITNQGIVYWPNLGYGKFGEKVVMSNAPLLDSLDQFDTRFVHLVDVDGTGTADLLYISKGKIRYYKNLSGNAWEEEPLPAALAINATPQTFIQTVDLLGNGTQCIVVSSSLPTQANKLRYWELTSGIKPFLLSEINNNMGGITKLHYCSSTKFYMQDKFSGKPWITKLPFPVHVLEKVETIDLVGNKHFTNRYAYHHGYFDPTEREFRGFGMVEQWDCECYTANCNDENSCGLDTPPVYTKTWFHTGFYKNRKQISNLFAEEYFKDDSQAWLLPDTILPEGLSGEEAREACRALRGSILRTEVYAQDETDKEAIPYTVEEKSYHLQCLRKKGKNKHAIFLKTDTESLLYHYERNVNDPRILHKLVLRTDKYGNEEKTAEIAYPRQIPESEEQGKILATYTENKFINMDDIENDGYWLIGVPYQTKQYELHNLNYQEKKIDAKNLLADIEQCQNEIDYADTPSGNNLQKRIIQYTRTYFWDANCETGLILGKIAPHALPCQQRTLELTSGLIGQFNQMGEKITETLLTNACKYLQENNNWFAVSDIQHFSTLPNGFYLPCKTTDPFGNETTIEYDDYKLFPVKITDALDFETTAEYDYRVLQTKTLTDPNENTKELAFDTLGMVTKLAISGKNGEGDTLSDPTEIYDYDLHCWKEEQKPVFAYIKKREIHGNSNTRCIESYIYTDGLGNEIMTKTTAEDGKAWTLVNKQREEVQTTNRWLAGGKVIYNNKGLPVKQYEPWYSVTSEFTFEDELTHYGVTPVMYYDPLGRLIKTNFPDDTTSKVEFDAWQQKNFDQNDCDNGSPHYNTPQIIDFDVLGRPYKTSDNLGNDIFVETKNKLDITGRIVAVTDALNRVATENMYALNEEHLLTVRNIDSGKRWMLNDTAGRPVRKWDERAHEFQYSYDELQRLTETKVNNAYVECLIYGEDEQENNIGQIIASYAQDGVTLFEYDFKGNIIFSRKQFTKDYNMLTNWEDDVELLPEMFTTETSYDALNRPVFIVHPDTVVSYAYDKGGLLQKVLQNNIEHVTNITYNPKGQRENIYYSNNTKTRYYYNPLNFRLTRLLTTRNAGQDVLQDLNYDFDAVGNIIEIRDDAQQTHYFNNSVIAPVATFEYDALYRLTKATGRELTALTAPNANDFVDNIPCPSNASNAMQNYTHSYAYDKLGNMLSDAWKTYQYATINNYLLGNNNIANQYTYDAHGNMLTMPHLSSMLWDHYDQFIGAGNGTFTSYYNYDPQGNRTRKVVEKQGGIREERYYIGGYEIYRKYNANVLNFERKTVNISDDEKVFVRVETETGQNEIVRFQYDNHLGSACLELDTAGLIISYEEYHPFGTTSYRAGRSEVEVSLKRYKYNGKERDEETGLYAYGMRYYAAWICRFVSVDPLQHEYPYYTPYQYAGNKPITYIDLDGLEEAKPKDSAVCTPPINSNEEKTRQVRAKLGIEEKSVANEGTIYLVDLQKGKNVINTKEVIELTNQRFEELGIPIKVDLITNPEEFISQELKTSETYAVLGSVTDVLNYIKEKDPSGFEKTYKMSRNATGLWEGGSNIEKSRNDYRGKVEGIAIDAKGAAQIASRLGLKAESLVSLSIMHGAGHNAGMTESSDGYPRPENLSPGNAAIMGSAPFMERVFNNKHSEFKTMDDILNKNNNSLYIKEMIRVYNLKSK